MEKPSQRKTADHFVLLFYNQVQELIEHYTTYKILLKEIELKYGQDGDVLKSLNENEKNVVLQLVGLLSRSIHKTYINYESLCTALEVQTDVSLKTVYADLSEEYVPSSELVKEYITLINIFLVKNIMDKIGSDILSEVESLYGGPKTA